MKRLATDLCPSCGAVVDAVTSLTGPQPTEGDLSFCGYCGGLHQMGAGLRLEPFSAADFDALPADERANLLRVQRAIRARPLKVTRQPVSA